MSLIPLNGKNCISQHCVVYLDMFSTYWSENSLVNNPSGEVDES